MVNIEDYITNPIKRHIIGQIMKYKKLRYSELMPEGVDNVLFNYHLQHLVKGDLLKKEDNFYSFTSEGSRATSHISYQGLPFQRFVGRFRFYIINDGKILLHKRMIGPWKGDTTTLWGKLIYGHLMEKTAKEQIKNSIGLDTNPKLVGTVRTIEKSNNGDVLDDSLYYICVAKVESEGVKPKDENDNPLDWYSFDEAIKMERENHNCGEKTVEVMMRFKKNNFDPFVLEEVMVEKTA